MKTILVLSDTHSNRAVFETLWPKMDEANFIFHLGDTSSDGAKIRQKYPDKTYLLNGNCDGVFPLGEDEITLKIEDVTLFACHGHKWGVKSSNSRLAKKAKDEGASLALYGHTHKAKEEQIDGVTCFNPGNLTRYGDKSYGYIVIAGDKFTTKVVPLS